MKIIKITFSNITTSKCHTLKHLQYFNQTINQPSNNHSPNQKPTILEWHLTFWQTISYFNPVVYLIDGLRFSFYGVSDFNIWISISSMVFFLVVCVILVTILVKKGYNIKS